MSQWFTRPRRPNGYAVVASILLVAGAIVISMRWASIDWQSLEALEMGEALELLAQRHEQTLPTEAKTQWPYETKELAAYGLSRDLHVDRLIVFDMRSVSLDFAGAESIQTPPFPAAGHVMYVGDHGVGEPVSVFMMANRGSLAVRPTLPTPGGTDVWLRWEQSTDGAEEPARGLIGSDETLIYIVISRDLGALQAAASRISAVVSGQ